jgi:hypothetical protein
VSERQRLTAESGVRVWVPGRPRTKGSLRPVPYRAKGGALKVRLEESGEYAVPWKRVMISYIKATCLCVRFADPVTISCYFRFERLCKPDAALDWPVRREGEFAHGDEDKLRRNALDALTQSGLILDDTLSVGGSNYKRFCRPGESPGVLLCVEAAPDHLLENLP